MIACVRVPNFALRLHVLDNPECDGEPMVLSSPDGERRTILDVSPEAAARYLRIGMSIRDARSMAPDTIIVTANPAHEAAVSERILGELEALSPFVEADTAAPGCWYLDLAGLDRLHGGPFAIAERLVGMLPPLLRPRVGLAPTRFSAFVTAGRARPGSIEHAPSSDLAAYLAGESIDSLPATPAQLRTMRQLGLDTLGALAALRVSAVAARFGPAGRTLWNLARGVDGSRIGAREPTEIIRERLELDLSTGSRDAVLTALNMLIQRASSPGRLRNRVARQVLIRLLYERGGSWEKLFALRNPAAGDELIRQVRLRLQELTVAEPVAEIELELRELGGEAPRQAHLGTLRGRDERPIAAADEHLKGRYRGSSLHRVVPVEPWSRVPERRFALMPLEPTADDRPIPLNTPQEIRVKSRGNRRPQVEPAVITMGGHRRSVRRIASRWFLNDEWWLRPIKRRYFIVELEDGARQTVYHDLVDQRWYAQDARSMAV